MPDWLGSQWGTLVVIPLVVAIIGGLASRDWFPVSGTSRLERTARLLQLARPGSHDAHLIQRQFEEELGREVDRREVRRRARWLTKAWWVTAVGLWVATLIATQVWPTLPSWWQWAYMAVAVIGISVPNGRIATIEFQVREERSKGGSAKPRRQQGSGPRPKRPRNS